MVNAAIRSIGYGFIEWCEMVLQELNRGMTGPGLP